MGKELHYLKALLATLFVPLTLVSWHLEETNQRKVNVTDGDKCREMMEILSQKH